MILIQIGGLGFMTFGVMVAIVLGKRIGLKQRMIIQQTTHSTSAQGLVKLSMYMVLIAFAFEALATIVLTLRWQQDFGWGQATYYALFHSVSAFSNAGFALWSDSLTPLSAIRSSILRLSCYLSLEASAISSLWMYFKAFMEEAFASLKVVLVGTGTLSLLGFLFIYFWRAGIHQPLAN